MDQTLRLALETITANKQAIVFVANRVSAEKTAEDIAKLTSFSLPELEKNILDALATPTTQCRRLARCVHKGVAFHHAGLTSSQKDLIEEQFRVGTIKIICATPTLAAGLSLPVFRVIIKSLKRFSGQWGMDWIPVLEYLQMAGRAGRPEYEAFGEAISIAKDEGEQDDIYSRYVCGKPESIYSKLAVEPVLRTHLLSLISTGIIRDTSGMKDFFGQTFWAHQFGDLQKLESILEKMLCLLREWKFVTVSSTTPINIERDVESKIDNNVKNDLYHGFVAASELIVKKRVASKVDRDKNEELIATPLGRRVAELYLDPLTAHEFLVGLSHYSLVLEKNRADEKKSRETTIFGLLLLICSSLEMRPLLSIRVREQQKIEEEMWKREGTLLVDSPKQFDFEYDDFLKAAKTALFLENWIEEKDEEYLLETFDIRPGEIRAKVDSAVWLLQAAKDLCELEGLREVVKPLHVLGIRVEEGVREEILMLLRLRGIGRIRARRLYQAGIRDIGDVKKVDITTLGQIIGRAIAIDVKKQVGEEVVEVPVTKRKGQLNLGKFG